MQRLASLQHRTPASILRTALEQYVDREEKRQQVQRNAEIVWRNYQASGLHVTDEEADAWMAKLEDGESIAPPTCHA